MKIVRTHDKFYANESYKCNTKDSFKFIGNRIHAQLKKGNGGGLSILDVGCSNGDFLYYLSTLYPDAELFGVDILQDLLDRAKSDFIKLNRQVPTFFNGDIVSSIGLPKRKFDMVFLNGVIGIFDNLLKPLENFSKLISDNGVGYIWSSFNNYNLDIFNKVRVNGNNYLESGWNIWSKDSVLNVCNKYGMSGVYYDFKISIDLEQMSDPLRSWTVKLENGDRIIINGMGLIHEFSLLELKKCN